MPITDLLLVLKWWTVLFAIGFSWLPFTAYFFKSFSDRGYLFSKVFGIIIISYFIFILGLFHLVSFETPHVIWESVIISFLIFFLKRKSFKSLLSSWKLFLFEEVLFFSSLLYWVYVKAHQPDIHGLEKFMDFGFVNSILRSKFFPPTDMWFPPLPINYYYFGHLVTAVLTKLSEIPSYITFDFMMATLFAFCFCLSFSIGAQLVKTLGGSSKKVYILGLCTGIFVTFAGNLQALYAFFRPYVNENPIPFWNLQFLPFTFPNSYWYPNATRFIYHTIHEFPIYSFVVSDLHGHVIDIPVVLTLLALLLNIFLSKKIFFSLWESIIFGFLLAVAYMTNAWDGLIYLLLIGFTLLYLNRDLFQVKKYKTIMHAVLKTSPPGFIISCLAIFLSFVVFVYPFSHFFKPFVSGIGVLCAPDFLTNIGKVGPFLFEANHCDRSPLWQLMILWGFFYFWVISFLLVIRKVKRNPADYFVLLCITLSTILIIIPEFIYAKDIYPAHYRANTMFKLVYQSFIMLSLSTSYMLYRIIPLIRKIAFASKQLPIKISYICFILGALVLTSIVLIYPFFAISSYYGDLKTYSGLNGTTYLKGLYPSDYDAINWINKNIEGQPVILEAQGDSYTDFARISANTGLPTVLGWTVHEWLWRGDYSIPAPRISDVQNLYESPSIELTRKLIESYHIKYIFIGVLERQKYQNLQEDKFKKLGKIVYKEGQTFIYKIY